MWLCFHGNDSLRQQSKGSTCQCFLRLGSYFFLSWELWHLIHNSPLYFKSCHHYECDFNTEGDKTTNIIVSLLLNNLNSYNVKLYFTLPFFSNDYNLHSFNKWSLSTYHVQMIMLDVLWDWIHTIEYSSPNSVFWNIYIYVYKVSSLWQLKAPSTSPPPTHLRQSLRLFHN